MLRETAKRQRVAEDLRRKLVDAAESGSLETFLAFLNRFPEETGERQKALNDVDNWGWTVLYHAVFRGNSKVISWLLSDKHGKAAGFDVNLRENTTLFNIAAGNRHLEACRAIINACRVDDGERKEMINSVDSRTGETALHCAAVNGDLPMVEWLLSEEEGGGRSSGFENSLLRAKCGGTALHFAAKSGHLECSKAIINGCRGEDGKRQEMLNAVDNNGYTVLHCAALNAQRRIIKWLLSEEEGGGRSLGFDKVLARTELGHTALHLASEKGHAKTCKVILNRLRTDNGEREEMLNAVNERGHTILQSAAIYGRAPVVSWLLSNEEGGGRSLGFANVLARTASGDTALHLAAQEGRLECFHAIVNGCGVDNGEREEMLNAVNKKGWTVLHAAVFEGCSSIISWLLSSGEGGGRALGFSNVLARTEKGDTVLHLAARQRNSDALRALLSHCTNHERMNLFLAVDKHGWTALHHAARGGILEVVRELLSYPECALIVNMKDNQGMTVLHRAIIRGFDKESREEWAPYCLKKNKRIIRALLGLSDDSSFSSSSSSSSTTTTTTVKAWIDPNIGLGLL